MAILIIGEKPSMARAIAAAIGPMRVKDGYMEGDGAVVTWCFGHLYELYDLEQYLDPKHKKGEKTRWELKTLPFYPENWEFKYDPRDDKGVKKQLRTIKELINRKDIDTIYAAGDADREGEVIARLVIDQNITQKQRKQVTIRRLWLPAFTEDAIRKGIHDAKLISEYEPLYQAGRARAAVDWMLGIELTRFATLKAHHFVRVGRCVVPIVEKIVQREQEIRDFVPKHYLGITSKTTYKDCPIDLTSARTFDPSERKEAEQYADSLNRACATVEKMKSTRSICKPGKLFSLSDLQAFLCKRYKELTPADVLKAVQELYEKGYVTYPRTGSNYLATGEAGKIDDIIKAFIQAGVTSIQNRPDDKNVYDDSKVESHSALSPTGKMPQNLTGTLQLTYAAIRDRFLAVFCEQECLVDKKEVTVLCVDEHLTLRGTTIAQPGWTIFEAPAQKEKLLPPLKEGEYIPVHFAVEAKQTTPPKRLTVESLNAWMKAPFRKEKDPEGKKTGTDPSAIEDTGTNEDITAEDPSDEYTEAEWKDILSEATICTEATRADTIDRCIKSGYIELKKGSYYALDDGFSLVKTIHDLGIDLSPKRTAALSASLHDIKTGRKTTTQVYEETKQLLDAIILA